MMHFLLDTIYYQKKKIFVQRLISKKIDQQNPRTTKQKYLFFSKKIKL